MEGWNSLAHNFSRAHLLFSTKIERHRKSLISFRQIAKTLLWCSLVEPTRCVLRRSPWQQFSPPRKNCQDFSLAGNGAQSAPLPARPKTCQFFNGERGGKNCCHGDHLGTQGIGSSNEHRNTCSSGICATMLDMLLMVAVTAHITRAPRSENCKAHLETGELER